MDRESAGPHEKFPHLPAKAKVRPDTGCSLCPLASVAGHETCGSYSPGEPLTDVEKFSALDVAQWQWQLQRRQIDADGVPGAYNDVFMDGWYPYNAKDSTNFADFSSWTVHAVSGNQVTLKTLDGSPAGKVTLYTYRKPDPQIGLKWVSGYKRTGCVQPGDVMQLSGNSKVSLTCWPIVTGIVSCTGDTLVVDCDKSATGALSLRDGESYPVTAKVWQHAGNAPKWRPIINPDYFYGLPRTLPVTTSDVPSNGVLTLSPDKPVMHPGGFDPLHPTWTFEGRRIDNDEWETVPQQDERLFVAVTKAYVAFKTTKPDEGIASLTLSTDLTATYDAFRINYFVYADPGTPGCVIVGYSRCIHAVPAGSMVNYTPPAGMADGHGCLKLTYDHHELEDNFPEPTPDGIDDTAVHELRAPSGLSRFARKCLQYNCCDLWQAAENGGVTAPFSLRRDGGHALRELWGNVDKRLVRMIPRVPAFGAWRAEEVGHPSLMWHAGYVGLQTPITIDEQDAIFRGSGLWAQPTVTSIDGDTYLVNREGAFDGFNSRVPTNDEDGLFPHAAPGFETNRDPLDATETVTQREMERIAPLVEKTSGQLQSNRGISQSTIATAPQDLIVPNVNTTTLGPQARSVGEFELKEEQPSLLRIIPLRQESKAAGLLGGRTVHSVSVVGGLVKIELENAQHTYSVIDDGPEIGDSYDKLLSWSGGGCWPIVPKPGQQINSHYEPNKYAGSRAGGAWRGDALVHLDRRFVISSVEPYGGGEAASWGDVQHTKYTYMSHGTWIANNTDTALGTMPETYGNIEVTEVKDSSTEEVFARFDDIERPFHLTTETYYQQSNELVFSHYDASRMVQIDFKVIKHDGTYKSGTFTAFFLIPETDDIPTMVPVDDWDAADTITVTADGLALAETTSDDPAAAEFKAYTFGDKVTLRVNVGQAGRSLVIGLAKAGDVAPPSDSWCLAGNLTSFGKKRDVVWAFDDEDGYLADLSAGDEVAFMTAAIVMMPGATLEWTSYVVDDWQEVAGSELQHGTGTFLIPEAWFEAKPEKVCFRVVGARWMDHRGIVSASVMNKTKAAVDALEWITTGPGPCLGGDFSWGVANEQFTYTNTDPENICAETGETGWNGTESPATGNIFSYYWGTGDGSRSRGLQYHIAFTSSGFGPPLPLAFLPEGSEILEAMAEIISSGMTMTGYDNIFPTFECGNPIPTDPGSYVEYDETPTSIDYLVLGFTSADAYSVIGTISGGTPNKFAVADITEIVQVMYAAAATGQYAFGYGIMAAPEGMGFSSGSSNIAASLQAMVPAMVEFNYCPGDTCYPGTYHDMAQQQSRALQWDNISITKIAIKVSYPDAEKGRVVDWFRWPAMVGVS